ncbi:NACHT domain-containing protein [Umezawaea endophytica]|uniref:NACHT domain-containing protein n=1 Tax=Umezawaea endophytica TaxID=1654476 RepID=A0A9X2VU19_9PSEU|nr:NACHT domain-containing protein [Umezawaea endophytica]MCS7482946.1 NACHT domain-containing protein [Umezawaea endophytica]
MTGWKRWAVALVVITTGAAAIVLASRTPAGLDSAAKVGALIAGLVPLALALILWARRSPLPLPAVSSPDQVDAAQRQLADLVLAQWRAEIVVRQLDDPAPVAVRWRLTELDTSGPAGHVARPRPLRYLIGRGVPRFEGRTDRVDDMATAFRRLPARRLVILGDPGMGKTTLAVLLLRELLVRPEGVEPVPVLLSMSGWDPGAETLHTWVARRLTEGYPALRAADFGPNASRALVEQRRILPVLDGLDELPERIRSTVLDRLNAAAEDSLILTCRTTEYEQTLAHQGRRGLTGAAIIEPDRLKAADAATYLERSLPRSTVDRWATLLTALREDQSSLISRALSSPLTLWLVRKVYLEANAGPAELCDTNRFATVDAITEHLLDHLVDALITANPPQQEADEEHPFGPRKSWDPTDAKKWLAFLAHHLEVIGSRDLAWWQLSLAVSRRTRSLIRLGLGTVVVTAALFAALFVFGFDFAVVFAPFIGLVFVLVSGSTSEEPVYADLRLRGRIRLLSRKLVTWPVIRAGLVIGLVVGVVFGLADRSLGASVVGLAFGPVFSLVVGLVEWAKTPLTNEGPQTPTVTFHRDLRLLYLYSLACGFAFGPVLGCAFGLVFASMAGFGGKLVAVLVFGSVFGSVIGFTYGLGQASGQHLVTVVVLRARGRVPLRLLKFLDDTHRLGILRAAGPVYQFRHAKLQDRLAQSYATRTRQDGAARGSSRRTRHHT